MSMKLISTTTVGSGGAASVEFTSIPQTYTDLLLRISARANEGSSYGDSIIVKPNGSTSNQSFTRLYGLGSGSPVSDTGSNWRTIGASTTLTANTFGNSDFYIFNYAGNANKSAFSDGVSENNGTNGFLMILGYLWSDTTAITSLTITANTTYTIQQHSTFSLYGITKGSDGVTTAT